MPNWIDEAKKQAKLLEAELIANKEQKTSKKFKDKTDSFLKKKTEKLLFTI